MVRVQRSRYQLPAVSTVLLTTEDAVWPKSRVKQLALKTFGVPLPSIWTLYWSPCERPRWITLLPLSSVRASAGRAGSNFTSAPKVRFCVPGARTSLAPNAPAPGVTLTAAKFVPDVAYAGKTPTWVSVATTPGTDRTSAGIEAPTQVVRVTVPVPLVASDAVGAVPTPSTCSQAGTPLASNVTAIR